jgi:hypothetical protein
MSCACDGLFIGCLLLTDVVRCVREIPKSDYYICHVSSRLSVCPSVRTEKHGSQWNEFHEILYLGIFRKSVEKIKVSIRSDKNNG